MNASHAYTLIERVAPWHPAEPTEAECLAIDRTYAVAKQLGILEQLRDRRALQQQINEEEPLV